MKTLEQIVGQLLRTEGHAARARWLVGAAVALWLGASAAALWAGSAEYFARAGAVGVGLVLVAFAFVASVRQSYHTTLLKGLVLVMRANLRDREGRPLMLAPSQAAPEDAETAARDYDHNLEAVGRLFARLDRRSNSARVTEVAAAVLATLQWGYGDLIFNRLVLCGMWRC